MTDTHPHAGGRDTRRTVHVDFARNDGPRRVALHLDPAQMTQRIMLEYLDAGRLYEQETTAFLAAVLRDGDAMLDIGAHVGWFSMFAAHCVGPRGAVWSFEPDARNFAHLVEHVALNAVPPRPPPRQRRWSRARRRRRRGG